MLAQKGAGSIPMGIPIVCLNNLLPTLKKLDKIKCLVTTLRDSLVKCGQPPSELQYA